MSTAGTTFPGRAWISSRPPTYVTLPVFPVPEHIRPKSKTTLGPDDSGAETPVGRLFASRTLNTFKNNDPNALVPNSLRKSESDIYRQVPPTRTTFNEWKAGREVFLTETGKVTITTTNTLETVAAERNNLLESDAAYKRRIKELETENTKILLDYESIFNENASLREKMDPDGEDHIEPYQRIYQDRKILREAEAAYKRRIAQLEKDSRQITQNFDSLFAENKLLQIKAKNFEEQVHSVIPERPDDAKKIAELQRKIKHLEKVIKTQDEEKGELLKSKHVMENQKYKLREEIAELKKNNEYLETENEGLKRSLVALGKPEDSSWKSEVKQKTRRQEEEERIVREEHAQFKKEIETMKKEVHKFDKVNVEMMTTNKLLQADKDDLEQRLYDLIKESQNRPSSAEIKRKADKAKQQITDLRQKLSDLKAEHVALKTKADNLEKDKVALEYKLDELRRQPKETASAIRRKMETEREIRDLKMHVENFQEKVKFLQAENDKLKNELKALEVETKALKQASEKLAEEQEKKYETQMKTMNETIDALNSEVKVLTKENIKLKADYTSLETKLQGQLEQMKEANKTLLNERDSLKDSLEKASQSNQGKMKGMQDEMNSLQVELQLLKPKYEDLQNANNQQKEINKDLSLQIQAKNKEILQLNEALRNSRDVYNELTKVRRENADLKREMEEIEEKNKQAQNNQEAELQELLKNQEFMNLALTEQRAKCDMLELERNELKKENHRLEKLNERQAKQISDLQVEMKNASGDNQSKVKSLEEELEKLRKEFRKTEKDLFLAKQEVDISRNEKENQVSKLMRQIEKLKEEREIETKELREQSDQLRSEVGRLKVFEERIGEMEFSLKELVKKVDETEDKNKRLTNERLAELQEVVGEMKNENMANRLRASENEKNELERYRMELEIKQNAINEIRKLKDENHRLLGLLEDKQAAEEAQQEWIRKRNKLNEMVAQNKRLQDENKRLLDLFENSHIENVKKELEVKKDQMKLMERKFQDMISDNAALQKQLQSKEIENKQNSEKAQRAIRVQQENNKLTAENKRLRDESARKDTVISSLKELEVMKAKYIDSASNNQRLYEENMRLRETIDKSKDYKSEFEKVRHKEKNTAAQQAKYIEENTLLKNTLQIRETELRREIDAHRDRASNLQDRNRNLVEELNNLKAELSHKDDILVKIQGLEVDSIKLKDATRNAARLYEENERLRGLLEAVQTGNWKNNFQNAKLLSADIARQRKQSSASSTTTTAVYVEPNTMSAQKRSKFSRVSRHLFNLLYVHVHGNAMEGLCLEDTYTGI